MAEPHTGTITFLFTDIEGFLSHRERNPKAMSEALSRHDEIFRTAIEAQNGHVFKTVEGAFYAAFSTALEALSAALDAQRGHFTIHHAEWEETGPLRVRMALHTGAAEERDGDYFGPSLNRVARLLSLPGTEDRYCCPSGHPGAGARRVTRRERVAGSGREAPQGSLQARAYLPDHFLQPSFRVPALMDAGCEAQQPARPAHPASRAREGTRGGLGTASQLRCALAYPHRPGWDGQDSPCPSGWCRSPG